MKVVDIEIITDRKVGTAIVLTTFDGRKWMQKGEFVQIYDKNSQVKMKSLPQCRWRCECGVEYENYVCYCRDGCQRENISLP